MTLRPPLRGSERRASGRSWMPFAAKVRWVADPALRPMPSWDFPLRHISWQKFYSDSARGTHAFWSKLEVRAREPARPAKTRILPGAPKWGIAHVAPVPRILWPCRDMWSASLPPTRHAGCCCGWSMGPRRRAFTRPPCMRRSGVKSRSTATGRPSASMCARRLLLTARSGRWMLKALGPLSLPRE